MTCADPLSAMTEIFAPSGIYPESRPGSRRRPTEAVAVVPTAKRRLEVLSEMAMMTKPTALAGAVKVCAAVVKFEMHEFEPPVLIADFT